MGLAIGAVTALLYKYKDKSDSLLLYRRNFACGAYEYLCSVFTEMMFGKVFWDYSKIPFTWVEELTYYIAFSGELRRCMVQEIISVFEKGIEKIPIKIGKMVTWVLIVFMSCNIMMSCLALIRYDERSNQVEAKNSLQIWLDRIMMIRRCREFIPMQ